MLREWYMARIAASACRPPRPATVGSMLPRSRSSLWCLMVQQRRCTAAVCVCLWGGGERRQHTAVCTCDKQQGALPTHQQTYLLRSPLCAMLAPAWRSPAAVVLLLLHEPLLLLVPLVLPPLLLANVGPHLLLLVVLPLAACCRCAAAPPAGGRPAAAPAADLPLLPPAAAADAGEPLCAAAVRNCCASRPRPAARLADMLQHDARV